MNQTSKHRVIAKLVIRELQTGRKSLFDLFTLFEGRVRSERELEECVLKPLEVDHQIVLGVGYAELAPGRPLKIEVSEADNRRRFIEAPHYTPSQYETHVFRPGALDYKKHPSLFGNLRVYPK